MCASTTKFMCTPRSISSLDLHVLCMVMLGHECSHELWLGGVLKYPRKILEIANASR
jgi:hypothetical protein